MKGLGRVLSCLSFSSCSRICLAILSSFDHFKLLYVPQLQEGGEAELIRRMRDPQVPVPIVIRQDGTP